MKMKSHYITFTVCGYLFKIGSFLEAWIITSLSTLGPVPCPTHFTSIQLQSWFVKLKKNLGPFFNKAIS